MPKISAKIKTLSMVGGVFIIVGALLPKNEFYLDIISLVIGIILTAYSILKVAQISKDETE